MFNSAPFPPLPNAFPIQITLQRIEERLGEIERLLMLRREGL